MKKIIIFTGIVLINIFMFGCQNAADNSRKDKVGGLDIYDFAFINKAPKSDQSHSAQEIIKVYFDEDSSMPEKTIAIDLEKERLYKKPSMGKRGLHITDDYFEIDKADKIIELIETYKVQAWDHDYTFEDPDDYQDGAAWSLKLQYEDGTVDEFGGQGTTKKDIIPENFEDFAEALNKNL